MYHSMYQNKPLTNDVYSVSTKQLKDHLSIIKDLRMNVVPFGQEGNLSMTFDDGFLDNLTLASPILTAEKIPFTIFMISDFIGPNYKDYLNSEHLKELSLNPLVTLGTHGKTHRPLADLSLNEAREEMRVSKLVLEDIIGKEVATMSFPHGSFNQAILDTAIELGYKKCGTSEPFPNLIQGNKVSRQCIYSCETHMSFKQKISGQWDWVWKNNNI